MSSATLAAAVVANSDGLVTVHALRRAGVDGRWIRKQITLGRWREPVRGVIDATGTHPTAARQLTAAHMAVGPSSFFISRSAGTIQGVVPSTGLLSHLHLGIPHGAHRVKLPGITIRQFRRIPDLEVVEGLPVTSPGSTIVTLAEELALNELRMVAADAVHRGIVAVEEIQAARFSYPRTVPELRLVIEELWAGAISGGEAAYWRGVKDRGLPLPELNVRVGTDRGDKIVDALWRRYRLVAEIDGRSVHDNPDAFAADRRLQNALQLRGLVVMRFAVSDVLSDLPEVMAVTESFLRRQARDLGLPWPPR